MASPIKMKTLVFLDSYAPDFNVDNELIKKTYKFITDSYFNFLYNAKILPWLSSNKNKEIKIIALDLKTYERLKQRKLNSILLKRDFSSEKNIKEDEAANREGVNYVRSLLKFDPEFKRVQEYGGLSLLDLEIFFSYRYVTRWIKKIKFLSAFIKEQKKFGFNEIVVFNGSINSLLLQTAAKKNAVKFSDKSPAITKASSFMKKTMLPFAAKMMIPSQLKKLKANKLCENKEKHKKKILVLTDVLRTIKLTAPWAKLIDKKKFDLRVISLNESDKNAYEKENIAYGPFGSYCTKNIIKNVNKKKKQLNVYFSKFKKNATLRNKLKYENCDFSEILFELFTYLFEAGFVEVVYYIEILKNIYEAEKPDLVIVFGDITKFARTVALTSRARGIKTLLLQHGGVEDVPIFGNELITDKIALFGSRYKDVYLKMGIDKKRLIVVGNMLYDNLLKKISIFDKNKIFNELGLDKNKKLLTYMSVPELNESEQEALMAPLIEGIKKLKNVQLVIKLHPTELDIDVHKKIIKKHNIDAKIIKDFDTYALIWVSDVIITTYSTVGSETAIMGKPLVTLNYFERTYIAGYSKEGIAIPAMKNNVAEAIEKALYDADTRKRLKIAQNRFLKGSCYKLDGKAGERVKELIENIVN